ncbi:Auxin-responsive protein SAUR36 [Linum perenne]
MKNGIKLGKKVGTAFKWVTRPGKTGTLLSLFRVLHRRAQTVMRSAAHGLNSGRGECNNKMLGGAKTEEVPPRGYLAVYVGESDDERRRVVVPVVYLNNPLFGELLKEAERVYGFDCPGGISIPCGYSKFEKVKMRINERDELIRRRGHFLRRWGLVR